jgi:hypothetical protein
MLPEINAVLEGKGLKAIKSCFAPIPTSSAWTAAHDLPRRAVSFTTETNYTGFIADRIRSQRVFIDVILRSVGLEISYRSGF